MNLYLLRSVVVALALLVSCQASGEKSSRSSILDYVDDSNVVVNAYIYRKDRSTGLYRAKIKSVFKGCNIEQYQTILIDTGSGSCGKKVNLRSGQRYLLFGDVMDKRQSAYAYNSVPDEAVLSLTDCAPTSPFGRLSRNDRQALRKISNPCIVHIPDDRTSYTYTCSYRDCGPLPYDTSAIHCPDGTTAGFTDKCVLSSNNRCEWEFLECPKCHKDSDCPHGHICENGYCAPAECHKDSDCGPHEQCKNGRCVACDCGHPDPEYTCHDGVSIGGKPLKCTLDGYGSCSWTYSSCPACNVDYDCVAIENGVCREGKCERGECYEHSDCENDEVCEYGYCVPCNCQNTRTEFLCDDGKTYGDRPDICTRKQGRCEYVYTECAPCYSNDDCAGIDYGICKNGQCEQGECYDSSDCSITEICEHAVCKPCECIPDTEPYKCHDGKNFGGEPFDCKRRDYGQCEFSYTECEDCQNNQDCAALGEKAVCKNGQCSLAECLNDHHCEDDELCVNHYCELCKCEDDYASEFLCHDLIHYGGKPIDCKRRNGKCSSSFSECPECKNDYDCSALDKGVCDYGKCVEAQCQDDHHCEIDEICEYGHCVKCDCGEPKASSFLCHDRNSYGGSPLECSRDDYGVCSWSYSVCEDCYSNEDCFALDKGVCKNGECIEAQCYNDHECAHDEVCENHHCVKCSCGEPDRTPFLCHNGVDYGDQPLRNGCKKDSYGVCSWHYSDCPICYDDADCSNLDYGICVDGECQSAECKDSYDCGESEYCDYGFCVECQCGRSQGKSRCSDGISFSGPDKCVYQNGKCEWTYKECPICGRDYTCEHGYECVNGDCVPAAICDTNNDCERDEFCNYSGKCVKCDCGAHYGDNDEHQCADGHTIGGYTGACIHGAEQCEWEYISCPRCMSDYDCSGGLYCVEGFCSETKPTSGVCHSNNDCGSDHYCAAGQCLPIGSCQSQHDCYNPSNDFYYELKNCPGNVPRLECSYGQCQAYCCQRPKQCLRAPCDQQHCRDSDLATCADDYCGGCTARFFTYDGSSTCIGY